MFFYGNIPAFAGFLIFFAVLNFAIVPYEERDLERRFGEVLQGCDPDALKQNLIAGVVDGAPLHNIELLQDWKARAATYPPGLAVAVVNRYAQIDHFWRWEMWLERITNLMMWR